MRSTSYREGTSPSSLSEKRASGFSTPISGYERARSNTNTACEPVVTLSEEAKHDTKPTKTKNKMTHNTMPARSEARNILKKLFINKFILNEIQRYLTLRENAIYE